MAGDEPEITLVTMRFEAANADAQRAHFDSGEMLQMATGCEDALAAPPDIDLLEGLSAHDLR